MHRSCIVVISLSNTVSEVTVAAAICCQKVSFAVFSFIMTQIGC